MRPLGWAIVAYDHALLERTRERVPLDSGDGAEPDAGNALRVLGERGDGGALRRAVAAYKHALLEITHERAPFNWAASSAPTRPCRIAWSRSFAFRVSAR